MNQFSFTLMAVLAGFSCVSAHADFSFVHVTDTHITASEAPKSPAAEDAALFREISALNPKPAFVVNTGDVCEIGTDAEYANFRKILGDLTVPHYAAPGNHDVRWNPRGKEGYVLGARQPLYQSWDYENIHFVLLDSTVLLQHWGHFDQAILDWLQADLQKVGHEKPIIIGFHHWIGRESVQVDNEQALLDVVAPYNVRLWLNGHGHSDIKWSVNGVPAIMAKGLYQGSYNLIEVTKDTIRVLRRTTEKPTPREILTIPLARPAAVEWSAAAQLVEGKIQVRAARGNLPTDAQLAFRLNDGKANPMSASPEGWRGEIASTGLMAGEQVFKVEATLADGRTYRGLARLTLNPPGSPRPVWTTNLHGAIQSRLVRAGETLYVSSMGGDLVALDPNNGTEKWRYKTGGAIFSTPHIEDNTVYFGSADHFVYALDANSGALKWKSETGGAVFAGAAVAQGIVCIASVDTKIYGLDAATGKPLWIAPGAGMYQSKAATDGMRFFVGGWDNFFRALDAKTGQELWNNKFGRAFYFAPAIASPAVGEGQVFVSSNDGTLHAMDAASGKVLWEVDGPAMGYSSPLFRDGRIYNGSLTGTGLVFCFNAATGAKIWEAPTGSVIYDSSCAWGTNKVYVGSVNGIFSAIGTEAGAMQWQYQLAPGHVLASPATDENRVYIASMNGDVTAFSLDPQKP